MALVRAQRAGTPAARARTTGVDLDPDGDRVLVTVEVAAGRSAEAVAAVEAAGGRVPLVGGLSSRWMGALVPVAVLPELSRHPAVVRIGLPDRAIPG